MSAPVKPETVDRVEAKLRDLRGRAARAPLPPPQQLQLERVIAEAIALAAPLRAAVETLRQTRGLALEDQQRLLARALALDAEVVLFAAAELRRVGRIRSAVRAFHDLLRRAPRDARFADHLASFSLLCEAHDVTPAAAMTRAVARTLPPAWWANEFARGVVEETLAALAIRWDELPEAGDRRKG